MKRNLSPKQRLFVYMDGWRDGSYGKPIMDTLSDEAQFIYEEGYTRGRLERGRVANEMAQTFGTTNSPLRAMKTTQP